jgi:hypothetical protein
MPKKCAQSFRAGRHRNPAPIPGPLPAQKGINVPDRGVSETAVLTAEPSEKLVYVPTSSADGYFRQTTFLTHEMDEVLD